MEEEKSNVFLDYWSLKAWWIAASVCGHLDGASAEPDGHRWFMHFSTSLVHFSTFNAGAEPWGGHSA